MVCDSREDFVGTDNLKAVRRVELGSCRVDLYPRVCNGHLVRRLCEELAPKLRRITLGIAMSLPAFGVDEMRGEQYRSYLK